MTVALPVAPALLQALLQTFTLSWSDPHRPVWYRTRTFGESHDQLSGPWPADGEPLALEGGVRSIGANMWLVQTLFCAPAAWWEVLAGHDAGASIVPVFFHRGRFVVGPGFAAGGNVCPTCAALRLGQAFPHPDVFTALLSSPVAVTGPIDGIEALLQQESLARFARAHRDRLMAGELAELPLSGARGLEWHRVLPPPGEHPWHQVEEEVARVFGVPHQVAWGDDRDVPPCCTSGQQLLDAFVGPLVSTVRVPPEPMEPEGLAGYVTITGFLGRLTRWHPDSHGSGLGFSEEQARWASVGEAVERYAGNYVSAQRLLYASEERLGREGRAHVPLGRFRWFTQEQEASPGWPLAPLRGDEDIPWIEAGVLGGQEEPCLLPAEFVCLNLTRVTKRQSRVPVPLAGIAAHQSRQAAVAAALLELIERDATMLWWHGGLQAKQLVALPDALSGQLVRGVPERVRQWFLLLPTEMPAFVVAGCLHDRERDILVVGFAARPVLSDALRKAAAEAWQLRRLSLQLLDQESPLWGAVIGGRMQMPVCRFRADRCYQEEFRADWRDMHQLALNLQYYLDPQTHPSALERLTGEPVPFEASPVAWAEQDLDGLVAGCLRALTRMGERAYCTDLTTEDMRGLGGGFTVVRVTCPGLVGNAPVAFTPLAHPRMQSVLAASAAAPYLAPMPHA